MQLPPKKYINIFKEPKDSSSGCSYYQSDQISNYIVYHGPPQNLHVFRGLYVFFWLPKPLFFMFLGFPWYKCIYIYIIHITVYYSPTIVVSGPPCPASPWPAFVARPSTEDQIRSKGWGSRQVQLESHMDTIYTAYMFKIEQIDVDIYIYFI